MEFVGHQDVLYFVTILFIILMTCMFDWEVLRRKWIPVAINCGFSRRVKIALGALTMFVAAHLCGISKSWKVTLTHVICLSDGKIAQGSKTETNIFRAAKVRESARCSSDCSGIGLSSQSNTTCFRLQGPRERDRRVIHVWSRFGHATRA